MNIFLTPIGTGGDTSPFIGLGIELAKRGHKVTVIALEEQAALIRNSGMRFISSGADKAYAALIKNPLFLDSAHHFGLSAGYVAEYNMNLLEILKKQARGEVVVVAHSFDFASEILSEKKPNVLVVKCHLSLFTAAAMDFSDRLHPTFALMTAKLRAALRLDPLPLSHVPGITNRRLATAWMWPSWLPRSPKHLPPRTAYVGFPIFDSFTGTLDPHVEKLLRDEPAPVVFTPGTSHQHAEEFFAAAVDSARRFERPSWLLTKFEKHLPAKLPKNVRHFPFIPLSQILSRCAALVHPGGILTIAAALEAGTPQVISPVAPTDQLSNGQMIETLGTGTLLRAEKFTGDRIARILRKFERDPKIKARCKAIAKKMAKNDGLVGASDLIEGALSSR